MLVARTNPPSEYIKGEVLVSVAAARETGDPSLVNVKSPMSRPNTGRSNETLMLATAPVLGDVTNVGVACGILFAHEMLAPRFNALPEPSTTPESVGFNART